MKRVVVLGGSNVSRGVSIIVETARRIVGGPAEYLIAMGHGRSYGQRSSILGRGLPGIAECGLWDALAGGGAQETFALITDVGNDIGYGVPVPRIAHWVESCLLRLAKRDARIVMTTLPLASVERLAPLHFNVARACFFPGRPITQADTLARTADLNGGLRTLGEAHGADVVEHDLAWYGLDPLHIRRSHLIAAWARILSPWNDGKGPSGPVRGSAGRWLRLRLQTPARWWLLGHELGRFQPFRRLPDGSTVSFF